MSNSVVRWNAGSDWISLTEVGREFQARDAAAGNARSPMVARRVGGTTSRVSTLKQTETATSLYISRRLKEPQSSSLTGPETVKTWVP